MKTDLSTVLTGLLVASPVLAAAQRPMELPVSSCTVLSGNPAITSAPDAAFVARIPDGKEAEIAFDPVAVEPDTLYRVLLRVRRTPPINAQIGVQELDREAVTASHSLGFGRGYAPLPASMDIQESWFASSPAGRRVRLWMRLGPPVDGDGALAVAEATLSPVGPVRYPATPSANYAFNPTCEATNVDGVVTGFSRWAGPHNATVAAGAGPDGSGAIEIKEYYLLTCASVPALKGYRYRISADFKGQGSVGFEWRGYAGHDVRIMGLTAPRSRLSPDRWQRLGHETVALPGQSSLAAVIQVSPAANTTVLVDNVAVIQVGQTEP